MMPSTQEAIFAVLFSVVLVFNIAGNSLVIYIIRNERGMKTPTNYLLLNLAVADLLFGVFLAPEYIFLPFFRHSLPDGVLGEWLCKLLLASNIAWMACRASTFTMICLSVERYFAVCRPHTFRQRFSPKIVKVLVMVSWIYAVVIASPSLDSFENELQPYYSSAQEFCNAQYTTHHQPPHSASFFWKNPSTQFSMVDILTLFSFVLLEKGKITPDNSKQYWG
ncbi:5-hydroxytryptamine receptor 7-like [Actinia tenebrosa]|uniref:5-hydroxytryptamine receptor 7-like n=1 Tax=Actinia tenebrosa TaxID=6105 RepID=A0A6P8IHB5_ACTTE|nr:5-hydroxytryptamine receptor 7-like [Actinia tenebrosa]